MPGVEELEAGEPGEVCLENARRKARAVQLQGGAVVLAADTVVALDGRIYGKPANEAEAAETLRALGGRWHEVSTGVCVRDAAGERTAAACTRVRLRPHDPRVEAWYLAGGEWRGRAGGYAIQGRGAALVEGIEGDWTNVVGLPVGVVLELLPDLVSRG